MSQLQLRRRLRIVLSVALAVGALSIGTARSSAETTGAVVVASPAGRSTASGTVTDPLDLTTALSYSSPVRAGGTLLLRGGTYQGAFVSKLKGTSRAPIVVRSYPGEWAVLDGGTAPLSTLEVHGNDVWFRDFEVMKSDPDRSSTYPSNAPSDVSRAKYSGVWVLGLGTKLINLVVHDNGDGIGFWRWSRTSAVYGCIIFNNGWRGSDRGWGHGIYVQNDAGTKTIKDNVIFNNFGYGVHAYDSATPIAGIHVTGVTSFENGVPSGARQPNFFAGTSSSTTDRITLTDNVAYHRPKMIGENVRLGFATDGAKATSNGKVTFLRNTVVGGSTGLVMQGWTSASATDNEIVTTPASFGSTDIVKLYTAKPADPTTVFSSYDWNRNAYVDPMYTTPGVWPTSFRLHDARSNFVKKRIGFPIWQQTTGLDASSTYTRSGSGTRVIVRPNEYQTGRAFVTVLNRNNADVVFFDLASTGLAAGQRFSIRDVQNLSGAPVYEGTYTGAAVPVSMNLTAITQPIGGSTAPVMHTPREFNAFVVVPVV